nr:hypothetical protein [Tanacetum cinerariifolium]
MSYDDIRPIFEAKFNSNVAFLLKTKEQIEEDENIALQKINETIAKRAAKRRKLDEDVEELKRHLQIVPNEDDNIYTEATPLARKVPVVDYQIIQMNKKPFYIIIRADDTHQFYTWSNVREARSTCSDMEESKNYTWSNKGQRMEATGIMWCADHNFYIYSADFVSGEEDNRPPMLVESDYESWKIHIESQGLPIHVFNILNQTCTGKEIWDNVELLMKGSGKSLQQKKEELFNEYERFRAIMNTKFLNNLPPYWAKYMTNVKNNKDIFTTTYVELYTYLKSYGPHALKTLKKQEQSSSIVDPLPYLASITHHLTPTQPTNPLPSTSLRKYPGNVGNTGTRGTQSYGQVTDNKGKLVICYNCHGEGHVSRQYAEAEAFLADVECTAPYDQPLAITTINIFGYQLDNEVQDVPTEVYSMSPELAQSLDENLIKEVTEFMRIFDEMDKEYEQCVLEKKKLQIEKKNPLIQNECLITDCIAKDICSIMLASDRDRPLSEELHSNCVRENSKVIELEAEILNQQQILAESDKRCSFI